MSTVHELPAGNNRQLVNDQAEQALLGALLVKPQLLNALPPTFSPEHYGAADHRDIHVVIAELGKPGVPAAMVVNGTWALNDPDRRKYLAALVTAAVSYTPDLVASYAAMITTFYRRRRLVALSEDIRAGAFDGDQDADGLVGRAMADLDELVTVGSNLRPGVSLDHALDLALAKADEAARREGPIGIGTGFPAIDEQLGGLEDGTLTVLAGRPGMGKSSLGWQIALNVARMGVGVLAISLEMNAAELGRRALSLVSGVGVTTMKKGRHAGVAGRLVEARRELHGLPLTIEDGGGLSTTMIALKARAAHRRHGVGLIMVDHLHIVRPDDADARHGATWAVGRISSGMKRLAKEFNCPVLLLAQLNRGVEGRDDKRPGLADLRQAGDIEQDADAVAFVYRAEYYLSKDPEPGPTETREAFANRLSKHEAAKRDAHGRADLIIAKVRDGAPGTVRLMFDAATTSFTEPQA